MPFFTRKGENHLKDFIVVIAMIILGVFIATLIISDDEGSLKSASEKFMKGQVTALGDG